MRQYYSGGKGCGSAVTERYHAVVLLPLLIFAFVYERFDDDAERNTLATN